MKIPKNVKILYKEYNVEFEPNLHDENGDLYGQILYMPERIIINSAGSVEQQKSTLLHEIVHGLDELYGIGLKEDQVEKLGTAMYMLVKDNPEMFSEE